MGRPSLNDIALKLGISKMTVSRALRGGKHVEEGLRERIVQMAEKMVYRPDPEIAKLMTHMRRTRRVAAPLTLAFVWAERSAEEIERSSWSQQLVLGGPGAGEEAGL